MPQARSRLSFLSNVRLNWDDVIETIPPGSWWIIPRRRQTLPSPVRLAWRRLARNADLRTRPTAALPRCLCPNRRGCNCRRSPFRQSCGNNRRWRGGGGRGRRPGASGSGTRSVSRVEQLRRSPSRARPQTGQRRDEPSLRRRRRRSLPKRWREVGLACHLCHS